ncbi:MAG: DNA-3-methyladenine glycosylase 2 family protein [Gammaproteobacteria bacterium]|nr:DNA-3-methyladenine glycosylase 2 family protein [Gammaproteobacteria bacterium]
MRANLIRDRLHYQHGLRWLRRRDATLDTVVDRWGDPPMWLRRPGFSALLHIILEQQVSLASARAVMQKLRAQVPRVTPAHLLALSDAQLKQAGFSRQKARYARVLAQAIIDGTLALHRLHTRATATARAELTSITGIGPWTANVYLLMALKHRDIWPRGDLALRVAMRELYAAELERIADQLPTVPDEDDVQQSFAQRWQPWRSLAVRVCWLHYLRRS